MDEIQSQKADVASMLRSVVQSSKGGVLVTNVQREYRLLVGEGIPFKRLGYRSLEDLLRDMPDVIRISRNSMGEMVIHAIADESTAHIASLIARQKGAKTNIKTKMPRRRPVRHSHSWKPQTPQYLPRMNPPPPKLNYSSNYSNSYSVAQNKTTSAPKKQFEESRESNFNSQPPPLQKVPSMRKPKPPRIRNLPPRLRNLQISPSPVVPLVSDNYTTFTSSSSSSSPPSLSPPPPLSPAPTLSSANNYVRDDNPPPLLHMASNREFVNSYANAQGFSITFRNLPLNPREFPLTYISTLRIGSQKFNSYPNDKPTIEEAEEEAARVAVESLDVRPGNCVYNKTPRNVSLRGHILTVTIRQ